MCPLHIFCYICILLCTHAVKNEHKSHAIMKAVSYMLIKNLCFFVLVCSFQFQFEMCCFQVCEYTITTLSAVPGLHAVMLEVKVSQCTPCSHTWERE